MRAELLRRVRAVERPVVVFDVDSTLLSTSRRHHAIATDFAAQVGDAALAAQVAALAPEDFGWTVTGPLPGLSAEQRAALERFWRDRFFSADYLDRDHPVPGAVDFVRQVHDAGAWITYLTARHLPEMGPATAVSLLGHGFPLVTGRANLIMKPSRAIGDLAFKRAVFDELAAHGAVIGTFENDPANANALCERFPDALNVLLDTVCAPDAPAPDPRLLRVPDFLRRPGGR